MKIIRLISIAYSMVALIIVSACGPATEPAEENLETGIGATTLDNGVKILTAADFRTPLVTIAARIDAGAAGERPDEVGYSSLLGRLLADSREGSAAKKMAGIGTSLNIDVQPDALYVSITCLEEDAGFCAKTILDLIADPAGDGDYLLSNRDELVSALTAAKSAAGTGIRELTNELLFGDSALGAGTDDRISSLQNLTAESFSAFIERSVRPERTVFALAGSLKSGFFEQFKSAALEWKAASAAGEVESNGNSFTPVEHKPIIIVDQPGDSASFLLVRRIPTVEPEQYYRVQAVNFILNGQSTYARLTALQVELRLNDAITCTMDLRGDLSSQLVTARSTVSSAEMVFGNLLAQLQTLYNGTVLDTRLLEQEVADARNFLRGQLMRNTESGYQKAYFILWADGYGFDNVDPEYHRGIIDGINEENLLEVIESHFQPVSYTLVVVGPTNRLQSSLSSFGDIEVVGQGN